MKSSKFVMLLILTLMLLNTNTRGVWVQASGLPGHDTYVDVNNTDTNFDGYALEVNASSTTCSETVTVYTQWDLSDVPGSATVATATLTLTTIGVSSVGSQTELILYETGDAWDETTLTWDNRPAIGAALATVSAPTTAGSIVIFSGTALRDYVAAQAGSDDTVSFALRLGGTCSPGTTAVVFADREDTVNNGPYLLLLNPNAVKNHALRGTGLVLQWAIVTALVLSGLVSLVWQRHAEQQKSPHVASHTNEDKNRSTD